MDNEKFEQEVGYEPKQDFDEEMLEEIFPEDDKKMPDDKKSEKKGSFISDLFDWVEIIAVSAIVVLMLFTFFMRLAVVDGPSMENTLHDKNMLVISDLLYTPKNNDIVVFCAPNYSTEPIVKRVIAVAGQTVDINYDKWEVTVDGKVIDEPYVKHAADNGMRMLEYEDAPDFPIIVPEGYVFVLGDNRNHSIDGRSERIGLVDERCILGKVIVRLFPINVFGKVE